MNSIAYNQTELVPYKVFFPTSGASAKIETSIPTKYNTLLGISAVLENADYALLNGVTFDLTFDGKKIISKLPLFSIVETAGRSLKDVMISLEDTTKQDGSIHIDLTDGAMQSTFVPYGVRLILLYKKNA